MPRKKKAAEVLEYLVPCRVTLSGSVYITAESAEAAKAAVDAGNFEVDHAMEMVDWRVTGEPRGVR